MGHVVLTPRVWETRVETCGARGGHWGKSWPHRCVEVSVVVVMVTMRVVVVMVTMRVMVG